MHLQSLPPGVRQPPRPSHVELNPGSSLLAGSQRVGDHYGRSRWWGLELLKEWYAEQQAGGAVRVLRRGRHYYTTMNVLNAHAPRGRDEQLHRVIRRLEHDLTRAFARISELERRIGRRR